MPVDLLAQFLETIRSSQTRRAYRVDLLAFFGNPPVSEHEVEEIDLKAVRRFLRSLEEEDLATSTRRRRLSALRQFLDWLVEKGTLTHNPARGPKMKITGSKTPGDDQRVLSEKELQQLVTTAAQHSSSGLRDCALVLTIVYGALRRSEVVSLEVEDVRPLGRHWIIDLDPVETYIKIPDLVVDAIESMKSAYGIKEGPLWRSLSNRNKDERMSPDAIYKVVRRTAEQAGIGTVNIETLRRTGLHFALQGGARLPQIQAHGRLKRSASAATYFKGESRSSLNRSAVDCIELDLELPTFEDQ